MKVRVTYLDGRVVEAIVGPRAQVEVERRHGISFAQAFDGGTGSRLEYLYTMCWAAVRVAEPNTVDFEPWLDLVAEADVVEDDAESTEADPTQRDR